jgi:hypothetical protein
VEVDAEVAEDLDAALGELGSGGEDLGRGAVTAEGSAGSGSEAGFDLQAEGPELGFDVAGLDVAEREETLDPIQRLAAPLRFDPADGFGAVHGAQLPEVVELGGVEPGGSDGGELLDDVEDLALSFLDEVRGGGFAQGEAGEGEGVAFVEPCRRPPRRRRREGLAGEGEAQGVEDRIGGGWGLAEWADAAEAVEAAVARPHQVAGDPAALGTEEPVAGHPSAQLLGGEVLRVGLAGERRLPDLEPDGAAGTGDLELEDLAAWLHGSTSSEAESQAPRTSSRRSASSGRVASRSAAARSWW